MQPNEGGKFEIRFTKMADFLSTPSTSEANFTGKGKFIRFNARSGKSVKSARTPWLSRRHTPYVKTPKTGRTSRSHPEVEDSTRENVLSRTATVEIDRSISTPKDSKRSAKAISSSARNVERIEDPMQEIVGKTLRVYQTSPLHNFDRKDNSSLETYGNQLSAFLQLETENQLLMDENGNIRNKKFKVLVSVHKDISADGSKFSAVKIVVNRLASNPRQTKPLAPILSTVFCSVGSEEHEDTRLQEHFTCLPICLVNGPVNLARILINFWQNKFDCRITPMTFSSVELGWYFSLWAGMSSPEKSTTIELCYDVSSVKGLSRILYSIEGKDAKDLWDNVHSSNSPIFTEEESTTFLKALESHFYHHFKINLEGLPLARVRTAVAYIASEGKLKIVHPRYANHILEQLTRAALTKEFYGRL